MGRTSGTFSLSYDTFNIPDQFDVYCQGALIYTTGGPVSGSARVPATFSGSSTQVTIVVTGPSGTAWDYTVACPV